MRAAVRWAISARPRPRPTSSRRADQDAYAVETLTRARAAIESGAFADEIAPVSVTAKGGDRVVSQDENPLKVSPEKIPGLRPAFRPDGTITAASSLGQR